MIDYSIHLISVAGVVLNSSFQSKVHIQLDSICSMSWHLDVPKAPSRATLKLVGERRVISGKS